ncbi:MAG: anthrone oxygenase family protein [Phyllobacterium sp.]|uniref:anthrone oxygenase family protein n=1 Tax=Phyllobacterium sp. TaxID=1871046 RepID=UPI0030F04610
MKKILLYPLAGLSVILSGAIFGFFYAWICSTMWGLDAADPRVAIAAMQAMNASVRNAVFAPAFFGTPVVLLVTAVVAYSSGHKSAAIFFSAGAIVYFLGGLLLTMTVNVPMNQALAEVTVPADEATARIIWQNYSPVWQFWNKMRALTSGVTLALTGLALFTLSDRYASRE